MIFGQNFGFQVIVAVSKKYGTKSGEPNVCLSTFSKAMALFPKNGSRTFECFISLYH
jgi:hypothetical protein